MAVLKRTFRNIGYGFVSLFFGVWLLIPFLNLLVKVDGGKYASIK